MYNSSFQSPSHTLFIYVLPFVLCLAEGLLECSSDIVQGSSQRQAFQTQYRFITLLFYVLYIEQFKL